jgi:GR25 family glycosyltransferase involved in LPS biosynthesis
VSTKINAFYINLAQQTVRRTELEQAFARWAPHNVPLHRIEAVNAAEMLIDSVPGRLRRVEKACYLSHVLALATACEQDGHAMIFEDDARVGPGTFELLDRALNQVNDQSPNWDLLYLMVMPVTADHMIEALSIRAQCVETGQVIVPSSAQMILAGACAYLINERAKVQVLGQLRAQSPIDQPVDGYYWHLARTGQMQNHVVFPLPCSVSSLSGQSQIQAQSKATASNLWSMCMQLLAFDRDLDDLTQQLLSWNLTAAIQPEWERHLTAVAHHLNAKELQSMRAILAKMSEPDFNSLFITIPQNSNQES